MESIDIINTILDSTSIIEQSIDNAYSGINDHTDDIFSNIVSLTSNTDAIQFLIEKQGEKDAQIIRGIVSQGLDKNGFDLSQIAGFESNESKEFNGLSDETVNNLVKVISEMHDIIENITPQLDNTSNIKDIGSNVELGGLINDFKTLSSLSWCKDWMLCLESIMHQASMIKDTLNDLPDSLKMSIGVDETSLEGVSNSIERVRENLSAEFKLKDLQIQAESESFYTPLSSEFMTNFDDYNTKLLSILENVGSGSTSNERFFSSLNTFNENTIKTLESSITNIVERGLSYPVVEPIGLENSLSSIRESMDVISNRVYETPTESLSAQSIQFLQPNNSITDNVNQFNTTANNAYNRIETGVESFLNNTDNIISNITNSFDTISTSYQDMITSTLLDNSIVDTSVANSRLNSSVNNNQNLNELYKTQYDFYTTSGNVNNTTSSNILQNEINQLGNTLDIFNQSYVNEKTRNLTQYEENSTNIGISQNPQSLDILQYITSAPVQQSYETVDTIKAPLSLSDLADIQFNKPLIQRDQNQIVNKEIYPIVLQSMEDVLIKNQALPTIDTVPINNRIESIISPKTAYTSSIVTNSNEAINNTISYDIKQSLDKLGEIVSNSKNTDITQRQLEIENIQSTDSIELNNRILETLEGIHTTLQKNDSIQNNSNIGTIGSVFTESQMKMFAKYVAMEMRSAFSTLSR